MKVTTITVGVLGFEPRTSALSELRSSQLSYTRDFRLFKHKNQTDSVWLSFRPALSGVGESYLVFVGIVVVIMQSIPLRVTLRMISTPATSVNAHVRIPTGRETARRTSSFRANDFRRLRVIRKNFRGHTISATIPVILLAKDGV